MQKTTLGVWACCIAPKVIVGAGCATIKVMPVDAFIMRIKS